MCKIPITTGYDYCGETSSQNRSIAKDTSNRSYYKELIKSANCVNITFIFKYYKVNLNSSNRKTTCPFPFHKGGCEHTASFMYYPSTNTYHCFGCKTGNTCVDFVSNMEGISKIDSALKILDTFNDCDTVEEELLIGQDFPKRLDIMVKFSDIIREFRLSHNDEKSNKFIENICFSFDKVFFKHKDLSNDAVNLLVDKLVKKINSY
jgi:DNA primase